MLSHWAACLALLQVGRRSSITRAAAWAKVGMDGARLRDASRFSATGPRPSATAVRLSWAMDRALARLTAGYGPRPMSRRRPSTTIRWTHDLLPEGAMFKYRPSPSPSLPGLLMAFAASAVSLPGSLPYHIISHIVSGTQWYLTGVLGNIQGLGITDLATMLVAFETLRGRKGH